MVVVVNTSAFPQSVILQDQFGNDSGLEQILFSEDGHTLIAIAVIDITGTITQSITNPKLLYRLCTLDSLSLTGRTHVQGNPTPFSELLPPSHMLILESKPNHMPNTKV